MKEGRDLDILVAQHVLGHEIIVQRKGTIKEKTRLGQFRPLRGYTNEIAAAWEVAQKMGVTLIPIDDGSWFGFVGDKDSWKSPAEFVGHLQDPEFIKRGAAISKSAPLTICLAALKAVEHRQGIQFFERNPEAESVAPTTDDGIAQAH